MKRIASTILGLLLVSGWGCGIAVSPNFPNQLVGADGAPLVLDDLEAIVGDPDLNDEEKREALRALGLEDEKLIEALLDL